MTQKQAIEKWAAMNFMERNEIMQKVGYMKSITKWQRACIAYMQKEG